MIPWQRRLRFGLGIFILVFALGLFFSLRKPATRVPPPPPARRDDPSAVTESRSGHLVMMIGARQDLSVDYDRLVQYADGRSRLNGARFKVPQRSGRDFLVSANEADIVGGQSTNPDVKLHGAVDLTSSDGFRLRTEEATYTAAEAMVRAPGPVTYGRGRMSGTAVGMTYDKNRDVLWLLDKVVIHIAADEKGEDAADIESGTCGIARRDKYMRFERGVKIARAAQIIQADEAVAYLTPDEKRIQMLELRGSSRVTGAGNAAGGLKTMTARDMNLNYATDGKTLQRALLSGNSAIELTGATRASRGRRITGEFIDVGLAPDGVKLTSLAARGQVQLDIPADATTPGRTIRSGALQCAGPPAGGLTSASFTEGVDFREYPPPPASARLARSTTLDLALKNGFDSIESARFGGGVRFDEGTMSATAREGRYAIAAGTLTLAGTDEKSGRAPQAIEEQATIEGKRLEILLDAKKITATESVKSELRPTPAAKPGSGGQKSAPGGQKPGAASGPRAGAAPATGNTATHLPAMLKQDQPVFATADGMVYDSDASHAVYTGHAQLWQGETSIRGDTVSLDSQKGDLSASGSVVSRMILQQTNETTKAKEQVRSRANAKDLVYDDSVRRLTYTTDAHMDGPEGNLAADRIEVYLEESGNEIDHLEGYGNVTIRTPDGRVATGDRLTYVGRTERYDVLGKPMKIVDTNKCESTGSSLTFFRSADRIIIDGHEEKRTETKGCGKSPGARPD